MYYEKTFVYVGDKKQWPQKIIGLFNVTVQKYFIDGIQNKSQNCRTGRSASQTSQHKQFPMIPMMKRLVKLLI